MRPRVADTVRCSVSVLSEPDSSNPRYVVLMAAECCAIEWGEMMAQVMAKRRQRRVDSHTCNGPTIAAADFTRNSLVTRQYRLR